MTMFSVMSRALLVLVLVLGVVATTEGFQVVTHWSPTTAVPTAATALNMGLFDGIMKAFENASYAASPAGVKASARHILVKTKPEALEVMKQLDDGSSSFATLAAQYSTCPSGSRGGSLGSFSPGVMVPKFDAVIFNPETQIGEVVGPVETNFGYHLIVVDKRTGV